MSVSFVRRNERKKESGGAVHIVYFVKRREKKWDSLWSHEY